MNVANDVKNGKNFLIFPEGTRSKNGNVIGEFKGGSFKSCNKSKMSNRAGCIDRFFQAV